MSIFSFVDDGHHLRRGKLLMQWLLCVVVAAAVAVVVIWSVPSVKRRTVGPQVSGRERGWGQVMV